MSNFIKDLKKAKAYNIWMFITYFFPFVTLLFFELLKNALKLEQEACGAQKEKGRFSPRWKAIHTIIVLIISGIGLLIWGIFDFGNCNENWNQLYITLGSTILLSGVSSIILQIFSSISFFQREMVKTFYDILSSDDKYLATIDYHHLRKNWKILSKYLYKRKFSEISDDLSDIISDKYFPRNHPVYYEDYRTDTIIKQLEGGNKNDEYVRLIETISLNIVANSKHEDVFYTFSSSIPKLSENDEITEVKIHKFDINGKNHLDIEKLEILKVRNGDKVTFENKEDILKHFKEKQEKDHNKEESAIEEENSCVGYHIKTKEFKGSKKYSVLIELEKVYSLKTNMFKSYNAVRIVKDCHVFIDHPEEMSLEFKNLGTVKKFKSINEKSKNILSEEYEGLILPSQGYVVGLRLK
jgi:hypothetical protein